MRALTDIAFHVRMDAPTPPPTPRRNEKRIAKPVDGPKILRKDTKTPTPEPGGFCGAQRTNREGTCMRPAGDGTDHMGFGRCKHHGGCTPAGKKSAAKTAIAREIAFLGDLSRDVDPGEALLNVVRATSALLTWIQDRLTAWDEGSATLTKRVTLVNVPGGRSDMPQANEETIDEYSLTRAQLFEYYSEERDRLARVSKLAIDAGIAERQVLIAENMGSMLITLLRSILIDLRIDPEDNDVRKIVYGHLIRSSILSAPADASEDVS